MKFIIKSESALLAELNAHFQAHPELYGRFGLPANGEITTLPADVKDSRFHDIFLSMYGGKLVMLEGDVQECEQTFQSKYSALDGSPAFYGNLNFPWTSFGDMAVQGQNPATLVLGFIHRYDSANSRWWLSAERFIIPAYAGPQTYPLSSTNTLFDLPSDGNVSPYSGGLSQGSDSLYDPAYFSNVTFDQAPISQGTYVSRLCYSWAELSDLFSENMANIPGSTEAQFSINFASMSSDYTQAMPGTVLVPFPHCVVMYMSYNGQPLLSNGAVVAGSMFVNHGADMGTMCPNQCAVYTWPDGLAPLV